MSRMIRLQPLYSWYMYIHEYCIYIVIIIVLYQLLMCLCSLFKLRAFIYTRVYTMCSQMPNVFPSLNKLPNLNPWVFPLIPTVIVEKDKDCYIKMISMHWKWRTHLITLYAANDQRLKRTRSIHVCNGSWVLNAPVGLIGYENVGI